MGNFNRNDRRPSGGFNRGGFGGGKSFGGGNRFGGRDGGRPPMNKAVCSECGMDCEVPFRPTGDRPVFCKNCFEKQRGNRRPNIFDTARPRFQDKPIQENDNSGAIMDQFKIINNKLDKIMGMLVAKSAATKEETPKEAVAEVTVAKEKSKKTLKKVANKKKK